MLPASSGTATRTMSDAMSAFMNVSLSECKAEDGGELVVLRLAQVAPVLDHRFHVRVDEEAERGVESADAARFRIGRAEVLVGEGKIDAPAVAAVAEDADAQRRLAPILRRQRDAGGVAVESHAAEFVVDAAVDVLAGVTLSAVRGRGTEAVDDAEGVEEAML